MNSIIKIITCIVLVSFSIAITALPLVTMKWIGFENSLFLMYTLEFLLGIIAVLFIYRGEWRFGGNDVFFKCLFFIFVIQTAVFIIKDGNVKSFQLSAEYILPFLFVTFLVPFYEECIYRGCLIDIFHHVFKGSIVLPVILSSIIFCGMHAQYTSPIDFITLFLMSLIFSFARVKSGSLLPSMLLHSITNAFVFFFNVLLSK
ncbi:type II CAAX endopeptidase family protein [Cedecea neteri]|uniref:CPBP family intramembrane glutamic endopeptidase n=1 Tax=Cedecea neteri TaxID=158822 RepID=UPI002AA83079|nr:type II CAAX endopeptidase family protein [Cedecea neteri]WPU22501.1 type II CAAX endopeptidase family protein [Cedecea neteri]